MSTWKALFVGDIYINQKPEKELICTELQKLMQEHDIRSCNFEGPLANSNDHTILKAGPPLCQAAYAAEAVLKTGFNLVSLANNHIADYSKTALRRTVDAFQTMTCLGAGENFNEAYQLKVVKVKDVKVGFLSAAEWGFGCIDMMNQSGFAWVNHPEMNALVEQAKKECDVLILQIHAGVEEIPLPLPEWRTRYKQLIDLGADVIVGHHPHIMQGWETYKNKPIFYSLGNFYFDSDTNTDEWHSSYCVSLHFNGNELLETRIIPVIRKAQVVYLQSQEISNALLNRLGKDLLDSAYEEKINAYCVRLWKERYKPYYEYALSSVSPGTSLKRVLRLLIDWVLNKSSSYKNLLLLHNLKIESHRYCVQRALTILNQSNSNS